MTWIASFFVACFILAILIIVVDFCITLYDTFTVEELLIFGGCLIVLIITTIIIHHVTFVME